MIVRAQRSQLQQSGLGFLHTHAEVPGNLLGLCVRGNVVGVHLTAHDLQAPRFLVALCVRR